jgi:hypothetical protein
MTEEIRVLKYRSKALEDNWLNDPTEREVIVFLPEKLKEEAPLLIGLAGFGGGARSFLNFSPMSENFTDVVKTLRKSGKLKDAVIAIPDCYTSLGGNQYINSSSVGNYEDFITDEIVPWIREDYSTGLTGVFGKSSGGFGSYSLATRHPDVFSGFADHSGDAGFEYCYFADFPDAIREFEKAGGVKNWFSKYNESRNKMSKEFMKTINVLAMSAFYSPNPESENLGIDFPFDLETGELDPVIWEKWLKLDPARNIRENLERIRSMKGVYLDVGFSDEFNINFGMRIMHRILEKTNVPHVFEEFEGGHFNITYREEYALSYLAERLSV